jgi:proteasome lid subunit RPN8/RPN11
MLKIRQPELDDLRRHGEERYPHECCGILLGRIDFEHDERVVTKLIRADNARTDSPQNRYGIDPRELISAQKLARERGEDIVGFYHSHPDHPAQWSPTDLAEAHWLGCSYVITSVMQGNAEATNSFILGGTGEEEKHFDYESIEVIAEVVSGAQGRAS